MYKAISKNVIDVKLLHKEIKGLLKERDNKNSSREKIEQAINSLDEEVKEITKANDDQKDAKENVDENFQKIKNKCRYYVCFKIYYVYSRNAKNVNFTF